MTWTKRQNLKARLTALPSLSVNAIHTLTCSEAVSPLINAGHRSPVSWRVKRRKRAQGCKNWFFAVEQPVGHWDGNGAFPCQPGVGLHANKPVWAQTFVYFNQQQKPATSTGFCTWATYLVSNHIPWLLFPRSSISLSHFAFLTPYHGSACAPLIKLELDKPDNSQLMPEDGGKCGGKIMMRARETVMEDKRTRKWETSIFNAYCFFLFF